MTKKEFNMTKKEFKQNFKFIQRCMLKAGLWFFGCEIVLGILVGVIRSFPVIHYAITQGKLSQDMLEMMMTVFLLILQFPIIKLALHRMLFSKYKKFEITSDVDKVTWKTSIMFTIKLMFCTYLFLFVIDVIIALCNPELGNPFAFAANSDNAGETFDIFVKNHPMYMSVSRSINISVFFGFLTTFLRKHCTITKK